jgi:hypothetical protein
MSTLELENIKHPDNSGDNIELAADGSINVKAPNNQGIKITPTGASSTNYLDFYDTGGGPYGRLGYDHNASAMTFRTYTSEKMRLTYEGNLGLGTTTPSEKFVVEDSANGAFIDIVGASSGDIASGIRVKQGSTTRGGFYTNPTHDMTIISDSGMTFRTNNANSNTIDSNGIFTNTTKPYFFAYSDAVNASLNPNVLCPFNLLLEYQGPNAYNTSTHRYTAPVAGIYQFNVHVYGNNSTNLHSFAIRVNGSIRSRSSGYGNSQSDTYVSGSASFKLTANDYVDVVSSGSGIVNFYGGSQTIYSTWSGYLVG